MATHSGDASILKKEEFTQGMGGHSENALDDAILQSWSEYHKGSQWRPRSKPMQHWLETETATIQGSSLDVNFNLLTGELLVNGLPLSRLPPEYERHPTYRRLFSNTILYVMPSNMPGMQFGLKSKVAGYTVCLGMQIQDLVISACGENGVTFQIVPARLFESLLPESLVQGCTHWYNTFNHTVEFRPVQTSWQPSSKDIWTLSRAESGAGWQLRKGQRRMVSRHSKTEKAIAAVLYSIEDAQHLHICLDTSNTPSPSLDIEVPRLRLQFSLQPKSKELRSRQFRGMWVDPASQSIGALMGLESKLVLVSRSGARLLLIPDGEVTWSRTSKFAGEPESNRHVVVTVKKGTCSGARAYQIDPQLGRLVDDGSFRSKVWLAYLHALTSFSISDPLTAHTGTEQALTILRSAAVRSLFRLHQEDLELLVNISRLTPLRQFYPVHLKVMQQVVWQRDMGFLGQHSQFYLTVKALLKQADTQKQLYSPDSAPSFVKSLPQLDEALLKYDLVNSAWTRAPGFGAGDFVTTHDRTYRGRGHNWNMKRANACFATSNAILSGSSSMPSINVRLNPHQLQGHLWRCFLPAGTVQGPKKPIPSSYPPAFDVAWLHNPKAVLVHICHIHTLLSQRSFATRHKVMSWLSSIAFEANSRTPEPFNILILQMLEAFVLIPEMVQIAPPVFDSFYVGAGCEFIAADIREIVEGGAREYWECPESKLAQLAHEDDDGVKERRAKAYREKMGGLVNGFISCLQEQWACASPTSPTGTEYETYFLVDHILSQVCQKYATWYANRRFHDYLGRIAKAMAQQPVSPFMEVPKPLPACDDDRRRSIKGFISMDDILANHQPPAISLGVRPILWLPETAATTQRSHAASSGRIQSLVQRLRSQASSEFEERYSKDLDDSVKALQEVSVQAPLSPNDLDTVKQALVSQGCKKLLQGPSSPEPPTRPKFGPLLPGLLVTRDVGQIGIANGSTLVPSKHGVDGLTELHRVGFVNAARVNPSVSDAVLLSLSTASVKLDRPDAGFIDFSLFDVAANDLEYGEDRVGSRRAFVATFRSSGKESTATIVPGML
ncbi:hypothetical protein RB597_010488 [Gaeumannomyces tritici]